MGLFGLQVWKKYEMKAKKDKNHQQKCLLKLSKYLRAV